MTSESSTGASFGREPSASAASTSGGRSASRSESKGERGLPMPICTFWFGARRFGLDVALVGEIVTVEGVAAVPLARPGLRGLFNLRGTPLPLIDTAYVLGARAPELVGADAGGARERAKVGIVLRHKDIVAALEIERMEAVVEARRGRFSAPVSPEEHPVVHGFLDIDGVVVTVLEPAAVLERLEQLRYTRAEV